MDKQNTFSKADLSFVINEASKRSFLLNVLQESLGVRDFFKIDNSFRVLIDLFLLSFFGGMFTVPQFAELQRVTPDGELSRIVAGNNIINSLAMVSVSLALMVFHAQHLSLSVILAILGFLNVVMCLVLMFFYKDEFNKFWRF